MIQEISRRPNGCAGDHYPTFPVNQRYFVLKLTKEGRTSKSAPKGLCVGSCEEEETEMSQNEPLGTIDLGSFEVLSDHGDAVEDDVDVNEFSEEATGVMPPLPPASWFTKTETSKHTEMCCMKFRKPCNGIGSMSNLIFFFAESGSWGTKRIKVCTKCE